MKHPILLIAASIVLLTACQSSQPALGPNGAEQLSNIHHLCILENAKKSNPTLNQQIVQSLTKYGISSETVDVTSNRKRLYEPECRYNLRYNTQGSKDNINYISLLIRTPEHQLPAFVPTRIFNVLKANKQKSTVSSLNC